MPTTPNYNFVTPTVFGSPDAWGTILNAALVKVDETIKSVADAAANASNLTSGKIPSGRFPVTMTGPSRYRAAVLGDDESPVYSSSQFPSTGVWFDSNGNLAFARGGSNKLTISNLSIAADGGAQFSGDGGGLTNLNASNLAAGVIPAAQFPTNMTGPSRYRAAGGGVGDPPFSFGNDADTGMYRSGENVITFTCGGESSMSITANGVTELTTNGFIGNGTLLTGLNASNLATGTVDNSRLPNTISQTDITASDLLSGGRLQVGGGTAINRVITKLHTWSGGGSIGAHTTDTNVATVSGAQVGDLVFCTVRNSGQNPDSKFLISGQVTSLNTVSLAANNCDGANSSNLGMEVMILVVGT